MKTVFILFIIVFSSKSLFANPLLCSHLFKKFEPVDISIALEPPTTDLFGQVKLKIPFRGETKDITLPAVVQLLRGEANLHALIFAGNTHYDGTFHNTGFHIFDAGLEKPQVKTTAEGILFEAQAKPESREWVEVIFDDHSSKADWITFKSEPITFRTADGEVAIYRRPGKTLLLIRPLGDYNEIGDFAIPIVEALKIPVEKTTLIHDDLNLNASQTYASVGQTHAASGNNAIYSINRGLAPVAIRETARFIEQHSFLSKYFDGVDIRPLIQRFDEISQQVKVSYGFVNFDNIFNPVNSFLNKNINKKGLSRDKKDLEARVKPLKQALGPIQKRLHTDKTLDKEQRQNLEQQRDAILLKISEQMQPIKEQQNKLDQQYDRAVEDVRSFLAAQMAYNRFRIGTGGPKAGQNQADHVLDTIPRRDNMPVRWSNLFWDLLRRMNL